MKKRINYHPPPFFISIIRARGNIDNNLETEYVGHVNNVAGFNETQVNCCRGIRVSY